jgi:hypothetical protein
MPSTKMFYRLKVTSPTGSVLYAYCSPRVVPSGSGWCTGKISKEEVESNSYFNTNSQLNNVYPNPSSSKIIVDVNISEMGNASISLFDFTGRFVQTLYDGQLNAGNQKMPLILPDLSNGVYFIQFRTGDCLQTTKINILR